MQMFKAKTSQYLSCKNACFFESIATKHKHYRRVMKNNDFYYPCKVSSFNLIVMITRARDLHMNWLCIILLYKIEPQYTHDLDYLQLMFIINLLISILYNYFIIKIYL